MCAAGSALFWCFCLCCALLATASPALTNSTRPVPSPAARRCARFRKTLAAPSLFHLTGQHGGDNDLGVLAAMSVLAAAKASGDRDAIAEAERALDAAKAKAKKTSAGKAAGGEQQRPRQQREVPPRTSSARPGPGEPSGFLVVPGRAEGVARPGLR